MPRSTDTPKHILNCAVRLFHADSFEHVSVEQICREAGVTRTTFYRHFRDKDALAYEFYKGRNSFSQENIIWIMAGISYIEKIVRAHLCFNGNDFTSVGCEMTTAQFRHMLSCGNMPMDLDRGNGSALILSLLNDALRSGEISPPEPNKKALELAATLHFQLTLFWCMCTIDTDTYARRLAEILGENYGIGDQEALFTLVRENMRSE